VLTLDLVVATQILMQLAVKDIGQVTDIQGLAGTRRPTDPGYVHRYCQHRHMPLLPRQTLKLLPPRQKHELWLSGAAGSTLPYPAEQR